MEQQELREWEGKCIQEEAPGCQAACPLHLDARGFCAALSAGNWTAARAFLAKTLPLPGILARLCHGPCQPSCRRAEYGGSLQLPALERAVITLTPPGPQPRALPRSGKKTALLGSGLLTLSAAWDLAKKGHQVTIFCGPAGPAGSLGQSDQLPQSILAEELATLNAWGVIIEQNNIPAPSSLLEQFGAVLRAEPEEETGAWTVVDKCTRQDPRENKIFAAASGYGGYAPPEAFIYQAAAGRLAATTLDRFLNKVSLTASREKEDTRPCRLFTNLSQTIPQKLVPLPADPEEKAPFQAEAARCLNCQCLECGYYCPFLAKYGGYPKKYARNIYNNLSIVKGHRQANRFINSCRLCNLCYEVCPSGFNMAVLCRQARQEMAARNLMPPSTHDFALSDQAQANSPEAALIRPPQGQNQCAWLLWPGCQLAGRAGDSRQDSGQIEDLLHWLSNSLSGGVGIALGCCGAPARWAGRDDLARASARELQNGWEQLGRPTILSACPACSQILAETAPQLTVRPLWSLLAEANLALPGGAGVNQPELVLSDPCPARYDENLQNGVRELLTRLKQKFREAPLNRRLTECCGFGGLMSEADPDLARTAVQKRVQSIDAPVVTYCAVCRDRLSAETSQPVYHLLDLLFPGLEPPLPPGISEIQERRVVLRSRILRRFYQQDSAPPPPLFNLIVPPQVRHKLNDRRILTSDLLKTLRLIQESGHWFINQDNRHCLAGRRLTRVTYWMEYSPLPSGEFQLHAAWSQRMLLPEPVKDHPPLPNEPTYLPASGTWFCSCGKRAEAHSLTLTYLGSTFNVNLLACPQCNSVLVPEDLALGKMREVEQLLEDK